MGWLSAHPELVAALVLLVVLIAGLRAISQRLDRLDVVTRADLDITRVAALTEVKNIVATEHEATRRAVDTQHERTRRRVRLVFEHPQLDTGDLPAMETQPTPGERATTAGDSETGSEADSGFGHRIRRDIRVADHRGSTTAHVNPVQPTPWATGPLGPHPTVQDGYREQTSRGGNL